MLDRPAAADLVSALQVDKAVLFSTAITVAAFVPLFTMQGVEGQIFSPMARTYGYALVGALLATFTVTPVLASYLLPEQVEEIETIVVRALRRALHAGAALVAVAPRRSWSRSASVFLVVFGLLLPRLGTEFLPALEEGNLWIRATMPPTISLEAGMPLVNRMREILLQPSRSHHRRLAARPAGQWQRRVRLQQRRVLRAAQAVRRMAAGHDQGEAGRRAADGVRATSSPASTFNFSQYIQDNVEEGLSGVKGANSVKIIGRDLDQARAARRHRS